jgi:hypothetical protein
MSKYQKDLVVIFKLGNLTLSGRILQVISCQDWTKDSEGKPTKIDSFRYCVDTIVGHSDVDEKNIIKCLG